MTSHLPRPALSLWMRLIIGLYAAALLSYIGMGAFSRMMADDFCTVATGKRLNPVAATLDWYQNWSGLYSNFFIKSAIGPLEPTIHPFITAFFILGIFGIMYLVLRDVLRRQTISHAGWMAFLLSGALTFGLIDGAVSRQPIFWSGALIPYSLPLILIVGALGLAYRLIFTALSRGTQILMAVGFALLVFLIAGFSEVYAVYEGALWGLLLVIGTFALAREYRGRLWGVMLLACFVTVLGLMIILASPGNAIRRSIQNDLIVNPVDLVTAIIRFTVSIFTFEPYGIVHFFLAFFASMGVWLWGTPKETTALPAPRPLLRAFVVSFLAVFALVIVAITPPMYGAGLVAARTLMAVRFTQLMLFALWGYWSAVGLMRTNTLKRLRMSPSYRLAKGAVLATFILIPAIVLLRHISLIGDFATYARQWDERDRDIIAAREQGQQSVIVDPMDYNLEEYLSLDSLQKVSTPEDAVWVYDCVEGYYGIDVELSRPMEIVDPGPEAES